MSSVMLQLQITMFLIMAVGYICAKKGMFTQTGRKALTSLFVNLMVPASIISAFCHNPSAGTFVRGIWMVAAYTFLLILCWLMGKVLYRGISLDEQRVLKYATMISNAQFMGFAVIQALFGSEGLVLASMAMIPGSAFTWTVGLAQFTDIDGRSGMKSVVTHPCFCAVVIGVGVALFRIPVYSGITDAFEQVGGCVMPVSMLIIGSILAETDRKGLLDWKLYYFSLVRLLLVPLTVYFIFSVVRLDGLVRNVAVLMAAMPAGTVTAMLAEKHGADARFASSVIFSSTLLSIVTLPVLTAVLL